MAIGRAGRLGICILGLLVIGRAGLAQTARANNAGGLMPLRDVAQYIAEAPSVNEVAISPDGQMVAYTVTRGTVAENNLVSELLLQRLDQQGKADSPIRQLTRATGDRRTQFGIRWRPDGKGVAYFAEVAKGEGGDGGRALMLYDTESGRAAPVPFKDPLDAEAKSGAEARTRPRIRAMTASYKWSPTGRLIAFTSASEPRPRLDPRAGILANANQATPGLPGARDGLFLLDMATGVITPLPAPGLHVMGFDWAPDESALVVSAAPTSEGVAIRRTDLFIVTRDTGKVRALVTSPGQDSSPGWSPDGKTIAFTSHMGEPQYQGGSLAVVPVSGGSPTRIGTIDDPTVTFPGQWWANSKTYAYLASNRMAWRVVIADTEKKHIEVVGSELSNIDALSFSADGRRLATIRSSLHTPPELFIQDWPGGALQQITRNSPDFPLAPLARLSHVSWRSADGRFTVHGLLLTPRFAWADDDAPKPLRPLPTVLFHYGGPSMVTSGFNNGVVQGGVLALAARGYAVLAVNSRGRAGYGDAFERSIRDDQSAGRLQHDDAMAGLDYLIKQGITDADRLGVCGHSYGGYLSAYDITRTTRFRAAVVHEGLPLDRLTSAVSFSVPGTDWALLSRDLAGVGIRDPWDPKEQQRLIDESPLFSAGRVKTPTLLQYGGRSAADTSGREFYGALVRVGIPVEFRVFDEGHVFSRPAAVVDSMAGIGSWFDYWLRDMPYPDRTLGARYDEWRASQRPTRTGQ